MEIRKVLQRASGGEYEADGTYFDKDSRARPLISVNGMNEAAHTRCELGWYHEQALVPMDGSFYI